MLKQPQLDSSAPWKQRFRAPVIANTRIARLDPTRGLAVTNRSGVYQLYAWDVPTEEIRQLTSLREGISSGVISPDGRYVYYFHDTKGNEIGRYVRLPFEGGESEDVTPDMPLYPTFGLHVSGEGNLLAFTTAVADEYGVYAVEIGRSDALAPPRLVCRSKSLILEACLSYDGTAELWSSLCRAATGCSMVSWLSIRGSANNSRSCGKSQNLGLMLCASRP